LREVLTFSEVKRRFFYPSLAVSRPNPQHQVISTQCDRMEPTTPGRDGAEWIITSAQSQAQAQAQPQPTPLIPRRLLQIPSSRSDSQPQATTTSREQAEWFIPGREGSERIISSAQPRPQPTSPSLLTPMRPPPDPPTGARINPSSPYSFTEFSFLFRR
jgi:hypothetical protein